MKQTICISFLLCFLMYGNLSKGQQVREYLDLQMHPTMFMAYPFFKSGFEYFDSDNPPKLTPKHSFKNVNYGNYWENNKGARIIVNGLIIQEYLRNPVKARQKILEQIQYIDHFVAKHPAKFVVARSPAEVRQLLKTTEKTIIVHSVEGAEPLVNSQEDAHFWAQQGIAFMTLIHLIDNDLGGSGIKPAIATKLINYRGSLRKVFAPGKYRGLTDKGKNAILWLANAGIMTDLTHMSDVARNDALTLMETHDIPPLVTHEMFKPLHNHPRGVSKEDLLRVYQGRGLFSTPISGESCHPYKPSIEYQAKLDSLEDYCEGSIDSYKFYYLSLKEFVEKNTWRILKSSELTFEELPENRKVDLAIGFQTDFNGWLNHSRPKFGKDGCFEVEPDKKYEAIELEGMPHPGLLDSQWKLMEKEGVDLAPIKRSAEKFLQMWEEFLARKGSFPVQ